MILLASSWLVLDITSVTDIPFADIVMSPDRTSKRPPLTPAVLHILLALADGDRHGYAIMQHVEKTGEGRVRMGPGTLYGSLQRMEAAGLVEESTARHASGGEDERRRYYRLTAAGRRALEEEVARLERLLETVKSARRGAVARGGKAS